MLFTPGALKSRLYFSGIAHFKMHLAGWLVFAIAVSLLLILFPAQALAQVESNDDVVRVSTDLLLYPLRIRDKRGQAVVGLTVGDLALKDQDRITKGLYFSPGTDRVALIFALDQSGSLREVISQQRDAAVALFERFGERSTVAVLRFAEAPSLVAPFNRELSAVRAAFRFFPVTNGHTAIFDAAAKAVSTFDSLPAARAERRIVVLISDGLDNASKTKPANVINQAIAKRVSFYMIQLPLFEPRDGRLAVRSASKGFRELAEKTGGKYFLAGNRDSALTLQKYDLSTVFQAIEEDLRSQYLLGFYVSESGKDGRRHVLSLSLIPRDIEYSVGQSRYSRTQKFFVNLVPGSSNLP
jgi:Ca-activated chloride channel homolog